MFKLLKARLLLVRGWVRVRHGLNTMLGLLLVNVVCEVGIDILISSVFSIDRYLYWPISV